MKHRKDTAIQTSKKCSSVTPVTNGMTHICPPPLRQRIGIPGLHENLESSPPPASLTGGRGLLAASRKKLPPTEGSGRGILAVTRSSISQHAGGPGMRMTAPKQIPTAAGLPEGSDSEVNVVVILIKNKFD